MTKKSLLLVSSVLQRRVSWHVCGNLKLEIQDLGWHFSYIIPLFHCPYYYIQIQITYKKIKKNKKIQIIILQNIFLNKKINMTTKNLLLFSHTRLYKQCIFTHALNYFKFVLNCDILLNFKWFLTT